MVIDRSNRVRTLAVLLSALGVAAVPAAVGWAPAARAQAAEGGATRSLAVRPPGRPAGEGLRPDVDGLSIEDLDRLAAESRDRWATSPHGEMLLRILPEGPRPSQLPEAQSRGARLTALYCVQCHHLPDPAMHDGSRWHGIVLRMVPRMEGKGNLGALMAEMMKAPGGAQARGLAAPGAAEAREIVAYLQRHAQKPLDPNDPELARALDTDSGRMFRSACEQCHALPDPRRHAASEWPAVVRRMQANMLWMNRVVGTRFDLREPQLRAADIVAFLQRHARR
ncbi:MAG TPA: hypothetical protein PK956_10880 [Burkholderiaceae bacterium]|nr:hypothetical protein [Burkholderiaceae bacterium]